MIVRIYSIGKIRSVFIKEGEEEYLKRLKSSPLKIERIELDAEHVSDGDARQAQEKEAARLLGRIKDDDYLIVLDERGKEFTSVKLAQAVQEHMNSGVKVLSFAIGGAYGWDESIYKRANLRLSLSQLTFPFQLTRLILVEQLYRAYSIIQGAPYHKS